MGSAPTGCGRRLRPFPAGPERDQTQRLGVPEQAQAGIAPTDETAGNPVDRDSLTREGDVLPAQRRVHDDVHVTALQHLAAQA